jgi:hypothetical protein
MGRVLRASGDDPERLGLVQTGQHSHPCFQDAAMGQCLQKGLLAELENPGDELEVTEDELESGAFRSASIEEILLVASMQDVMSACLEEEHTLEVFKSLNRQDDELVAELEKLENLTELDDIDDGNFSQFLLRHNIFNFFISPFLLAGPI